MILLIEGCPIRKPPDQSLFDSSPENIAARAVELLSDPSRLAAMRLELKLIRDSLGSSGASMRAARTILQELE